MSTMQFRRDIQKFLAFPAKTPAGNQKHSLSSKLSGDHETRNRHAIEDLTETMDVIARHHQEHVSQRPSAPQAHAQNWEARVSGSDVTEQRSATNFTELNKQLQHAMDAYQVLGSNNSLGKAEEIHYMREVKNLPVILEQVAEHFQTIARHCSEDDPTRNELNGNAMYARNLRRSVNAQLREMEGPGLAVGDANTAGGRRISQNISHTSSSLN